MITVVVLACIRLQICIRQRVVQAQHPAANERVGLAVAAIAMVDAAADRDVRQRPLSELLVQLSEALAVPVDHLLGSERKTPRTPGPVSRARQIFARVSQLPRATQQRMIANGEDALTAHEV